MRSYCIRIKSCLFAECCVQKNYDLKQKKGSVKMKFRSHTPQENGPKCIQKTFLARKREQKHSASAGEGRQARQPPRIGASPLSGFVPAGQGDPC